MSAMQRRKGAVAEREVVQLLSRLGHAAERNLSQSRDGGHDVLGVGRFALEVKRQEKLAVQAWWRQACEQARKARMLPALAYRQSRQPWRVIVPLGAIIGEPFGYEITATLCIDGFSVVARRVSNG